MKMLLIENRLSGHHKVYLQSLIDWCKNDEIYIVIPSGEKINNIEKDHILYEDFNTSGFFAYIRSILTIRSLIKKIKPDIINFLYADDLYRYFGIGLRKICKKAKIVLTCHHLWWDRKHILSYRALSKEADALVVHTDELKEGLNTRGIRNVVHIEYPQFGNSPIIDQQVALSTLGVKPNGSKVLLALGGTRKDKGLDILLEALKEVKEPFYLVIAGAEQTFKREYIEEKISSYKDKASLFLEFLSDDKFALCLNAADIIVLPYRKEFDGASGPLGEGVWHYKEILGPSHGSLGGIISRNHLGQTFRTEDAGDLAKKIKICLLDDWKPDAVYLEYRKSLDPEIFNKRYCQLYKKLLNS